MSTWRNPFGRPPPPPPGMIRIALWGPTGAGKSWLVHAFARQLEVLSSSDARHSDPNFEYRLLDEFGHPVSTNPAHLPPASAHMVDTWLKFSRRPKPGNSHRANEHELTIHDNMGALTVSTGVAGRGDDATEYTLARSLAVIVLLDAGSLDPEMSLPEDGLLASDTDYEEHLGELLRFLGNDSATIKYVAVCLSKADMWASLRADRDDPARLVRMKFRQTYEKLNSYRGHNDIRIAFFNTSAVGFLPGSRRLSNFDPGSGFLLKPDRWRPFNAAAPFFWIFNNIETEGMAAAALRRHPAYPLPVF